MFEVMMIMVFLKSTGTSLVVCQPAVIKNLQQDVEHIRVGFFDLIQQYHGIGLSSAQPR